MDGGWFTAKPCVASGQHVRRMSNYCRGCHHRPEARTGDDACPITVLFWNFLDRHERALAASPRTALMARNLARLDAAEREADRRQAAELLGDLDAP